MYSVRKRSIKVLTNIFKTYTQSVEVWTNSAVVREDLGTQALGCTGQEQLYMPNHLEDIQTYTLLSITWNLKHSLWLWPWTKDVGCCTNTQSHLYHIVFEPILNYMYKQTLFIANTLLIKSKQTNGWIKSLSPFITFNFKEWPCSSSYKLESWLDSPSYPSEQVCHFISKKLWPGQFHFKILQCIENLKFDSLTLTVR